MQKAIPKAGVFVLVPMTKRTESLRFVEACKCYLVWLSKTEKLLFPTFRRCKYMKVALRNCYFQDFFFLNI
jgi:hypothetical protein